MNEEISIPPRLGTEKCYDCGREPTTEEIQESAEQGMAPFWEKFIIYFGKQVSVPVCPQCQDIPFHGGKIDD